MRCAFAAKDTLVCYIEPMRNVVPEFFCAPLAEVGGVFWRTEIILPCNRIPFRRADHELPGIDALKKLKQLIRVRNVLNYIAADDKVGIQRFRMNIMKQQPVFLWVGFIQPGKCGLHFNACSVVFSKHIYQLVGRAAANIYN